MGFLDDVQGSMRRGGDAINRKHDEMRLNRRIKALEADRKAKAAELGASLYELVRDDPFLLEGREELVADIEAIDRERAECVERIEELWAQADAAQAAAATYICTQCGATLHAGDKFCSICGAPAADSMAPAAPPAAPEPGENACPACGNPVEPGQRFCMVCGSPVNEP